MFNFIPFSLAECLHTSYIPHDMDASRRVIKFFHLLYTPCQRHASLAQNWHREKRAGREKKKIKIKKIHSHVPADNDRDSIRAECSRHLTTLRFATEMVGRVFAIGMKMWIYMLNETFEDSFTVVQVCCLHFFPFYLIDLMIE